MRIGLFIDTYYPLVDGVIKVVDNYAKYLTNKGHKVVVICPDIDSNYKDNFKYKVIRVHSRKVPLTNYKLATISNKLKKELINEQFDIVHIHSPFTIGKLGIEIANTCHIPVVATMHTQFKKEFKRYTHSNLLSNIMTMIIIKSFNRCDECWSVNKSVGDVFVDYGYKGIPITMNNATDLSLVDNYKGIDEMFNLNKDNILFLFVGRITILKNILFIVDVLNELKKTDLHFKMIFVGPSQDNALLQNRIDEYKLNDCVSIHDPITDRNTLAKLYNRTKLFIFPSLFDASSLVQIEAASQKTPTIFIKGSVTSNGIVDNETGFLANNDIYAFANKIEEIINNKKLYDTVSNNVYNKVYRNWDKATDEALSRYQKLVEECKK